MFALRLSFALPLAHLHTVQTQRDRSTRLALEIYALKYLLVTAFASHTHSWKRCARYYLLQIIKIRLR